MLKKFIAAHAEKIHLTGAMPATYNIRRLSKARRAFAAAAEGGCTLKTE
jgi:hypothetical protein